MPIGGHRFGRNRLARDRIEKQVRADAELAEHEDKAAEWPVDEAEIGGAQPVEDQQRPRKELSVLVAECELEPAKHRK